MSEPTIFFFCTDPERALGLERLLPNFHIVCIDGGDIVEAMREKNVKIFSLSEELDNPNPIKRNTNVLLQNPKAQEYIKRNTSEQSEPSIMVFKVAPNIERTCEKLGYNLLNTSSKLNRKFELKISQYQSLSLPGIRFPETIISSLQNLNFDIISKEFGLPFVIQFDRGHTGGGTIFIREEAQLRSLAREFPKRIVRTAKMISGTAWTINACVTRFGIAYGGLSKQITGIKGLTKMEGGTVGNDWSASKHLDSSTINQVTEMTRRIGSEMYKANYSGIFGVDFIIDDGGEVFVIEVNARPVASISMHNKIMLQHKLIPFHLLHISEFLFASDAEYLNFINQKTGQNLKPAEMTAFIQDLNIASIKPIEASQIILRNTSNQEEKVKKKIESGVYNQNGWVRSGYSIDHIQEENEFLVLYAEKKRTISPNSEVGRIQAKESIINQDGKIEKKFHKAIKKMQQGITKLS
ncbi:ATP-grasp domain-containing protein [Candidatus Nomurabacteria bacterium]|nr:ATP-grasp domain-containing protein [Candidatus Nomurabacteria bacterium]